MANQHEEAVESPPTPEADQGGATSVATRPQPTLPKPKMLPPYKVLLHNDDVNDFEHVIRCIIKLTQLSLEEAVERTWQAHAGKVALLLVTHRERAELYCEQFACFQLTVTAEPDA